MTTRTIRLNCCDYGTYLTAFRADEPIVVDGASYWIEQLTWAQPEGSKWAQDGRGEAILSRTDLEEKRA